MDCAIFLRDEHKKTQPPTPSLWEEASEREAEVDR